MDEGRKEDIRLIVVLCQLVANDQPT